MFSKMEQRIINLLNQKPKMTHLQIARRLYKGKGQPSKPNRVVSALIHRINVKCTKGELDWKIEGSGLGVTGRTVWIQKLEIT